MGARTFCDLSLKNRIAVPDHKVGHVSSISRKLALARLGVERLND
jgi:hypothetical protein